MDHDEKGVRDVPAQSPGVRRGVGAVVVPGSGQGRLGGHIPQVGLVPQRIADDVRREVDAGREREHTGTGVGLEVGQRQPLQQHHWHLGSNY